MAGAETKTGSTSAGLRLLSLIAALSPAPACAGAWIAPEGGQEIWTTVVGERGDLNFYESSGYIEAPIGADNSIVAAPWVEQNYDTVEGWRGEAVIGVKHAVFRTERSVAALQAGALWLSNPEAGCSEGGIEARALGGRSFGQSGFANVEVAARALEGGCSGERLDLTTGYRPHENWLAMGQVFIDVPNGGDETVKLQVSLVRFGGSGRGLQVGVRARIDGGDAEPALVIGLWGRPGQ